MFFRQHRQFRQQARLIPGPFQDDRQFVNFPGNPGHGGGAQAADHDHRAVDFLESGAQNPAHPQQFAGQFAVAMLDGDDELVADFQFQFLEQAAADQGFAPLGVGDPFFFRQVFPEGIDLGLGDGVDPHQQNSPTFPARLGQPRQIDPG